MPKSFLSLLLLSLPLAASAECGFVSNDEGLTVIVSGKSNGCFGSPQFRQTFRDKLVASVQAMESEAPPPRTSRKSIASRSAGGEKLWSIAQHNRAPSYYGQR